MGRGRSAVVLSGSAAASAALGWVTLVAVGRLEGPSAYGTVAVIWAAYYASAGVLAGLQHEVTRARVTTRAAPVEPDGMPLGLATALIGGVGAALLMATFPLWQTSVGSGLSAALAMGLGVLGLTGLVVTLGLLGADRQWHVVAGVLLADAAVRLGAVLLVGVVDGGGTAYVAAVAGASWVWLLVLVGGRTRRTIGSGFGIRLRLAGFLPRAGASMLATGCAALIVAGLPWLIAIVDESVTTDSVGLLAALVLFRSPVLAIVNSLRPLVLTEFLAGSQHARESVEQLWKWCAALGVLACLLAYGLGTHVLQLAFGAEFVVTRGQASGLVGSGVLLAMATIATMALMALDAHGRVVECWGLALVTTVLVLIPLGDDSNGVVTAAVVGPLSAIVWTVWRGLPPRRAG